MAPPIPSAELRLSYPLYAVDFDPEDANRLLVGGGGGAARSGVGNKITLLDASHDGSLQIASEIELSRDEDSVNTLAVGPRRGGSVVFYTGINSAEEDLNKGKNEHFRVFTADLPSKATADAKIAELSRSALFSTTDTEAYQRLLKVSGQVGAAATGTIGRSTDPQIAIFDIPAAGSSSPAPKLRGKVELVREAMDMDIIQISDDEHQLIYCDEYDVYTLIIGKSGTSGPHSVFTMPHDESSGAKARPSLRCIRFLTPTFALAVANLPKASGAVLQGFRLPKIADLGKEEKEGRARLALSAHLPKRIPRATGMAVRNLSPPATPSTPAGDTQFAVAVTGQDSSITLYTLDHQTVGDVNLIANLHPITTLKEVHQGPISGLAFSKAPPSSSSSSSPQKSPHLKLASIGSMANTCVVHSLPLKRLPPSGRSVLALKSRKPSARNFFLGSALFFALLALLLQGVLEVQGLARPVVGARGVTPVRWHKPGLYYGLATEQQPAVPSPLLPGGGEEAGLFRAVPGPGVGRGEGGGGPAPRHRGGGSSGGGHDEERHGRAQGWEELPESQRRRGRRS
ncbi:hypothetical protein NEMBOFW57_000573 [Staphylotrichum longicolle]|uniref:Guanine nucleotide-exchange factor SEC12 n=1 Tax=Staphylotrichum longicolle TaxID=669026 RepID=A0AAD4F0R9_9PEZI|nr:hypothetical protein NEMBOFW57_000573 [Staphylotrichum longicolle]